MTLDQRVIENRDSKEQVERIIEEYKPFIASCAQKTTGRYLSYGYDDELSIALIAFNEAIEKYELGKGSFLAFARMIIFRRIADYFRKESKTLDTVPLENDTDEDRHIDNQISTAIRAYENSEKNEILKMEIECLENRLSVFSIKFNSLVASSPGQKRTREKILEICKIINNDEELRSSVLEKGRIPNTKLENKYNISPKKTERFRTYIITVIELMNGDYEYIRNYINI